MDNPHPQSGAHLKEGHEETDLSIRGILWFGVFLVVGGIIAFGSMYGFYKYMESNRIENEAKMTLVEQQLQAQREAPKEVKAEPGTEVVEGVPEVYGQARDRKQMEAHLKQTFPGPRLQYNDERDMQIFRGSEDQWLNSTGKDANGNIHIPVEKAMEKIAAEGLPAVSGPWQPPTLPTAVPMVPAQTAARK